MKTTNLELNGIQFAAIYFEKTGTQPNNIGGYALILHPSFRTFRTPRLKKKI